MAIALEEKSEAGRFLVFENLSRLCEENLKF